MRKLMTTCLVAAALALTVCASSLAADARYITVQELAELAEMSPATIRALFNPSAAFGRYPLNYVRAKHEWDLASKRLAEQGIIVVFTDEGIRVDHVVERLGATGLDNR